MNKVFAEATTNTAFSLTLSKKQVNCLLLLELIPLDVLRGRLFHEGEPASREEFLLSLLISYVGNTFSSLTRRGLVYYGGSKESPEFCGLSTAGQITCKLLAEAGLSFESTAPEAWRTVLNKKYPKVETPA